MLKKMLLVLDGQTGVLDRGIHKKNQIISNINLLIDKFDTIQQPILFTRHTNKTSLVAETGSWELVSTIRCPETPIYFNKKRSNIFVGGEFYRIIKKAEYTNDIHMWICYKWLCAGRLSRESIERF